MYKIILLLFAVVIIPFGGNAEDYVPQYFQGSSVLEDQYGVCSHVTRKGNRWNYSTRKGELDLLRKTGVKWVRSDLDADNVMPNLSGAGRVPMFDTLFQDVKSKGRGFFPILSSTYRNQFAWEGDWYDKYLQYVTSRYGDAFSYWEVMNEVDLIMNRNPKRNVSEGYMSVLKKTYAALKKNHPKTKVLSTSFCDKKLTLLDFLCRNGNSNYWDILNLHSYSSPETLPSEFGMVKGKMNQYKCPKPVWLTECGVSTAPIKDELTNKGFYADFLPVAMRQIGLEMKGTDMSVLADPMVGYSAVSQNEVDMYLKGLCKSVRYVSFDYVRKTPVSSCPILIVSGNEDFPIAYFDIVVDYVRRGGTIVLAGGAPFYYDVKKKNYTGLEKVQVGDRFYSRLHMSSLFWWSPKAKQLGAPEVPTYSKNLLSEYKWDFSQKNSSRFMSEDNLRGGDRLIKIVEAGNQSFKGCVAGVYALNSDLKGNVIFQTRMGVLTPVSEAEQARRIPRIHLISFANGVDKVFVYNLRSSELDRYDKESHFGILRQDLSPKPAYYSYKTLIEMCPSGSSRPKLTFKDGIYIAEWKRPDGKYVVSLWTPIPSKNIRLDTKQKVKFVDYMGRNIENKGNIIHISPEVQYLISSSPLKYVTNYLK